VRRDDAHTGQLRDDERPGEVRGGDAVDGEHRALHRPLWLPDAHAQVSPGDGHIDGAVIVCHQRELHPPSIVYEAPVTMPAASDASQPASDATSPGSTSRLTALSVSMIFSTTSLSGIACRRA